MKAYQQIYTKAAF